MFKHKNFQKPNTDRQTARYYTLYVYIKETEYSVRENAQLVKYSLANKGPEFNP